MNPDGGNGYVNGPLRSARFRHSQGRFHGLACDGKGRLYVADKVNAAIRMVDLKARTVSTIAGRLPDDPRTGPRDGPGAAARFHPGGGPTTIFYDRTGDRFVIHDDDSRTIRTLRRTEGGNGWFVGSLGMRFEGSDGPVARSAAGVPCGVDAEGNIYLSRANHIQVLKRRREEEE